MINICIVAILWLGGDRIGAGYMEIGDITALTEYSILILFYIIMAQMVIILLPRARVCIRRIQEVFETEPEICDGQKDTEDTETYGKITEQSAEADCTTGMARILRILWCGLAMHLSGSRMRMSMLFLILILYAGEERLQL